MPLGLRWETPRQGRDGDGRGRDWIRRPNSRREEEKEEEYRVTQHGCVRANDGDSGEMKVEI